LLKEVEERAGLEKRRQFSLFFRRRAKRTRSVSCSPRRVEFLPRAMDASKISMGAAARGFRARTLDLSKPLLVVHESVDEPNFVEENVVEQPRNAREAAGKSKAIAMSDITANGSGRSTVLLPTGVDAAEENEEHLQDAIRLQLQVNRALLKEQEAKALLELSQIPIPMINPVDETDVNKRRKGFDQPRAYIHYEVADEMGHERDRDRPPDYDLDSDDEAMLAELNAAAKSPKQRLTEIEFERMVDQLEKCAFDLGKTPNERQVPHLIQGPKAHILPVYEHWKRKRRSVVPGSDRERPLLHRFIRPPDPDDPDPRLPFREKQEVNLRRSGRKDAQSSFDRMLQLRKHLELARHILQLVKDVCFSLSYFLSFLFFSFR
jgi:Enhancer of polycomb-like